MQFLQKIVVFRTFFLHNLSEVTFLVRGIEVLVFLLFGCGLMRHLEKYSIPECGHCIM